MRKILLSILVFLLLFPTFCLAKEYASDEERTNAYADTMMSGTGYVGKGDYSHAVEEFSKAIDIVPVPTAYIRRAECYIFLGKMKEARADIDYALKYAPDNADVYNANGLYYEVNEEPFKAIENYTISLEKGYTPVGSVYFSRGNSRLSAAGSDKISDKDRRELIKAAAEDYGAAAENGEILAYIEGGLLYYGCGILDKAAESFNLFLEAVADESPEVQAVMSEQVKLANSMLEKIDG